MGEKVIGWNGFVYMLDRDMRNNKKIPSEMKVQDSRCGYKEQRNIRFFRA